jgi:hypothetical protein
MLIPDEVRKCVVFLMYRDKNQALNFAGTAFFVGIQNEMYSFPYLITAKHVIVKIKQESSDGNVYIRINDKQGGSKIIGTESDRWSEHPTDSSVDVSVLMWAPPLDEFDYLMLPEAMMATEEIIHTESIGLGDEVFITGLFFSHFGKSKNIPIVRVGNIASMPEEKIDTLTFGSIDVYLIEARSIGGLSGSPVFVHKDIIKNVDGQLMMSSNPFGIQYLLGLIHGHWDIAMDSADGMIEDANEGAVNMGIAMVVPAVKIIEIINQPKWIEERQSHVDAKNKKN